MFMACLTVFLGGIAWGSTLTINDISDSGAVACAPLTAGAKTTTVVVADTGNTFNLSAAVAKVDINSSDQPTTGLNNGSTFATIWTTSGSIGNTHVTIAAFGAVHDSTVIAASTTGTDVGRGRTSGTNDPNTAATQGGASLSRTGTTAVGSTMSDVGSANVPINTVAIAVVSDLAASSVGSG